MPLSSCIEHKTLRRICDYEPQRPEFEVTKDMWKKYFLNARHSDTKDYARLAAAMRGLSMDVSLSDAESRVTRLIADFHSILDSQDMDDFALEEPKLAVQYLCNALRPQALKMMIFTELKKTVNKPLKKSVQEFLKWLTPKVQAFCMFESAIPVAEKNPGTPGIHAKATRPGSKNKGEAGCLGVEGGRTPPSKTSPEAAPAAAAAKESTGKEHSKKPTANRKCYKCGDSTQTVFQCAGVTKEEDLELVREHMNRGVGAVG